MLLYILEPLNCIKKEPGNIFAKFSPITKLCLKMISFRTYREFVLFGISRKKNGL